MMTSHRVVALALVSLSSVAAYTASQAAHEATSLVPSISTSGPEKGRDRALRRTHSSRLPAEVVGKLQGAHTRFSVALASWRVSSDQDKTTAKPYTARFTAAKHNATLAHRASINAQLERFQHKSETLMTAMHSAKAYQVAKTEVSGDEDEEHSATCPNVEPYSPIGADCATAPLWYVSKKLDEWTPCTKHDESRREESSEPSEEDIATVRRMCEEDGADPQITDGMNKPNLQAAGMGNAFAKLTPSPITANDWVDGIITRFGRTKLSERCWYLGEKNPPHDKLPSEAMEIDYLNQVIMWEDGTTLGNALTSDCALSATIDRELKAKSDRLTKIAWIAEWSMNLITFALETLANVASAWSWFGDAGAAVLSQIINVLETAHTTLMLEIEAEQFALGEAQTHPTDLASKAQKRADANTKQALDLTTACLEEAMDNVAKEISILYEELDALEERMNARMQRMRLEAALRMIATMKTEYAVVHDNAAQVFSQGVVPDWGVIDEVIDKYVNIAGALDGLNAHDIYTESFSAAQALMTLASQAFSEIAVLFKSKFGVDINKQVEQSVSTLQCKRMRVLSNATSDCPTSAGECSVMDAILPSATEAMCELAVPRANLLEAATQKILNTYEEIMVEHLNNELERAFDTKTCLAQVNVSADTTAPYWYQAHALCTEWMAVPQVKAQVEAQQGDDKMYKMAQWRHIQYQGCIEFVKQQQSTSVFDKHAGTDICEGSNMNDRLFTHGWQHMKAPKVTCNYGASCFNNGHYFSNCCSMTQRTEPMDLFAYLEYPAATEYTSFSPSTVRGLGEEVVDQVPTASFKGAGHTNATFYNDGMGMSYNTMRSACSVRGQRLCTYEELCPKGPQSFGFDLREGGDKNKWAPILRPEGVHDWVLLGKAKLPYMYELGNGFCLANSVYRLKTVNLEGMKNAPFTKTHVNSDGRSEACEKACIADEDCMGYVSDNTPNGDENGACALILATNFGSGADKVGNYNMRHSGTQGNEPYEAFGVLYGDSGTDQGAPVYGYDSATQFHCFEKRLKEPPHVAVNYCSTWVDSGLGANPEWGETGSHVYSAREKYACCPSVSSPLGLNLQRMVVTHKEPSQGGEVSYQGFMAKLTHYSGKMRRKQTAPVGVMQKIITEANAGVGVDSHGCGAGTLPLSDTKGCSLDHYTCTEGDGPRCCEHREPETRSCVPCDETLLKKPGDGFVYTTPGKCDYAAAPVVPSTVYYMDMRPEVLDYRNGGPNGTAASLEGLKPCPETPPPISTGHCVRWTKTTGGSYASVAGSAGEFAMLPLVDAQKECCNNPHCAGLTYVPDAMPGYGSGKYLKDAMGAFTLTANVESYIKPSQAPNCSVAGTDAHRHVMTQLLNDAAPPGPRFAVWETNVSAEDSAYQLFFLSLYRQLWLATQPLQIAYNDFKVSSSPLNLNEFSCAVVRHETTNGDLGVEYHHAAVSKRAMELCCMADMGPTSTAMQMSDNPFPRYECVTKPPSPPPPPAPPPSPPPPPPPLFIPSPKKAVSAVFGQLAIDTNGQLHSWGAGCKAALAEQQLDSTQGDFPDGNCWYDCDAVTVGWAMVSGSLYYSCGIRTDGILMCWGWAQDAGIMGHTGAIYPAETFKDVACGFYQVCAITTSGYLRCFRRAHWDPQGTTIFCTDDQGWPCLPPGQLKTAFGNAGGVEDWSEDGKADGYIADDAPIYQSVQCGMHHCCALTTTGEVKCWGHARDLYVAWKVPNQVPYTAMMAGPGVILTQIALSQYGLNTACGIDVNDKVVCWGDDIYSIIANKPSDSMSMVSVGTMHACGVTLSGDARCWGDEYERRKYANSYYNFMYNLNLISGMHPPANPAGYPCTSTGAWAQNKCQMDPMVYGDEFVCNGAQFCPCFQKCMDEPVEAHKWSSVWAAMDQVFAIDTNGKMHSWGKWAYYYSVGDKPWRDPPQGVTFMH